MEENLISICIPTFNRSKRLEKSLNITMEVIKDIPGLNVCVSDNASTDNTVDVLSKFHQRYKRITYRKNNENLGFKKNLINALLMSKSKYCWLMGDDDYIIDNNIDDVVRYADEEMTYDIIVVNGLSGSRPIKEKTKIITDRNDVLLYLGAHMSWISSIIFSKKFLTEKHILDKMNSCDNAFPHITAIFDSLPKKCRVLWISNRTVMPIGGFTSYYNRWFEIFIRDWFLVIDNVKGSYSSEAVNSYLNKAPISIGFLLRAKYNGFLNKKNRIILLKYMFDYPKGLLWIVSFSFAYIIPNYLFVFYDRLKIELKKRLKVWLKNEKNKI